MLLHMFEKYVQHVGLAALVVSTGLLIMVAARDAFEIDEPKTIEDPVGGAVTVWPWRYMSGHAEAARWMLQILVRVLRMAISYMVVMILLFLATEGAVYMLVWWGEHTDWVLSDVARRAAFSWNANVPSERALQYGLGATVVIFGPLLIWCLAATAYRIVMARLNHRENK